MRQHRFFSLIAMVFLLGLMSTYQVHAQVSTAPNPAAVFQDMQAQQAYLLQQQAFQQQQLQDQMNRQTKAADTMAKNQAIAGLVMGMCSQMLGLPSSSSALGMTGEQLNDAAYDMDWVAYSSLEKQGFYTDSSYDAKLMGRVGSDANAKFQKGCNNFINKEGQLGPWGSYALSLIKTKEHAFGKNIPDDITTWCPKYPAMDQGQREMYWVWILMSMASSESSCNPMANNPNAPDGVARGLFQVWDPVCPKARDLSRPNENIQCAVDLLADELGDRETLMTPTSKGKAGTYWGPLRSDDWNKKRGGDISGAKKTRGLMEQYPYCK